MKYTIRNCNQIWTVDAEDKDSAIKQAFKQEPPKNVGLLVEIKEGENPTDNDIYLISGHDALEIAEISVLRG
jgi:hypothetical protein